MTPPRIEPRHLQTCSAVTRATSWLIDTSKYALMHYNNFILKYIRFNLLKPTGHVMHQQFNIQQLYALPHTVFICFVFI